jgi:hypothetical protein
MVALTKIEEVALEDLRTDANRLANGEGSDVKLQGKVIAQIAHVLYAMASTGTVTQAECSQTHSSMSIEIANERSRQLRDTRDQIEDFIEQQLDELKAQLSHARDWKTAAAVTLCTTLPLAGAVIAVAAVLK